MCKTLLKPKKALFQCLGNKSQKYHTLNKRLDYYSYNLLNKCYNFVQQDYQKAVNVDDDDSFRFIFSRTLHIAWLLAIVLPLFRTFLFFQSFIIPNIITIVVDNQYKRSLLNFNLSKELLTSYLRNHEGN